MGYGPHWLRYVFSVINQEQAVSEGPSIYYEHIKGYGVSDLDNFAYRWIAYGEGGVTTKGMYAKQVFYYGVDVRVEHSTFCEM